MSHPKFWIGPALFVGCLLLGTWLRWEYPRDWLQPNTGPDEPAYSPYMVEADAYTRLIRVRNILDGQGLVQSFHPHENYPEGITPSTTLPFDLVILSLHPIMSLWSAEPLDWAGAFAAYVCFPIIFVLLYFWSGRLGWRWEARGLLLVGITVTPGIMWATPFARPDHQALVLLMLSGGLAAELIRWRPDRPDTVFWAALGGACWAFALWTSLFEPLILFALILVTNLIARRREQHPFLISFGVVAAVAILVEGAHLREIVGQAFSTVSDDQIRSALGRWSETVNELKPMYLSLWHLSVNLTALVWLLPVTIACLYRQSGLRLEHHLLTGMTVLLTLFAIFQVRWFYYATLGLLLLTALWIHREKLAVLRYGAVTIVGLSWIVCWAAMFGEQNDPEKKQPPVFPQVKQLARLADQENSGSVMGVYWLSPAFSYFSGRPMVASSSHLTIEGIVDTSRFFTTSSWIEANRIAQEREAGWILCFVPSYQHMMSEIILGEKTDREKVRGLADLPVGFRLYVPEAARAVPSRYQLVGVQPLMKLYRVAPKPPPPSITP
ncbi:MAG: hypothetical protein AAGK14_06460 [Verrucomicrobiota bacterium]